MLLIALLLCPLLAAALAVSGVAAGARAEKVSIVLSGLGFLLALWVAARVTARGVVSIGPEEFLRVDGLSVVFVLIVTGVALVSLWFGERGGTPGRLHLFLA